MAFSIVWIENQLCSVPDPLAILGHPVFITNKTNTRPNRFPLNFHKIPTLVEFPAPGQLSKVKSLHPGQFFSTNPRGLPWGCIQLKLTEILHNANEYEAVLPYQGTSHSEVIIYSRTRLYQTIKKNRNGFSFEEVRHTQTFIKANQIKEKQKCVWYSRGFVISRVLSSEFDCG